MGEDMESQQRQLELDELHARIVKMGAESAKLYSEVIKLGIENLKLQTEIKWYPFVAGAASGAAFFAALLTVIKLFF